MVSCLLWTNGNHMGRQSNVSMLMHAFFSPCCPPDWLWNQLLMPSMRWISDFPSLYHCHFLIKHPAGFFCVVASCEIDWHRLTDNAVLSVMFAVGPNLMQRERSGFAQRPLAAKCSHRAQRERGGGSVCAPNSGVCLGKGRGQGVCKLWFTPGPPIATKSTQP